MVLREVIVVDSEKRQKLMLVVVAVLALGAGSYWYLGRDSGGGKSAKPIDGVVERKQRAAPKEDPSARRKTEAKPATRQEPATVERKEREAPEDNTVDRKKRREDKTKEKKKTLSPAA